MQEFNHKLIGIYPDATTARVAYDEFLHANIPANQVDLITPETADVDERIEPHSDSTRDQIVKEAGVGATLGGSAGAVGGAGVTILAPTLFVSAPVVAPLMVMGYGAIIGSMAGAINGLRVKDTVLAGVTKDAIHQGYSALVVHSQDQDENDQLRQLLQSTLVKEVRE